MPSADAHCSKMESSLYGLLINGLMASLFLQESQNRRESGVDILVEDEYDVLFLTGSSIIFSSSVRRITKLASRGNS